MVIVDDRILSLSDALSKITINPARILGIDVGNFNVGALADVCIFNSTELRTIDTATMKSRGTNTPFDGQTLPGIVYRTLMAGQTIYSLDEKSGRH